MSRTAAGLLVAGCVALAACGQGGAGESTEPLDTARADVPSASGAVDLILARVREEPDFHTEGFRSGELVTEHFIDAVDDYEAKNGVMDFDPFLCAQQLPSKITVVDEVVQGDSAQVTAELRYGSEMTETKNYYLDLIDGVWKLNHTDCMG